MDRVKDKLIIKYFIENTSFHGVNYLSTKNKSIKIFWLLLVILAALGIILSTGLMVNKYLSYEDYMTTEYIETNGFNELPNILLCSYDRLSIVNSIIDLYPNYKSLFELAKRSYNFENDLNMSNIIHFRNLSNNISDIRFDEGFLKNLTKTNSIPIKSCQLDVNNVQLNCTQNIVMTFNGVCLLITFEELILLNNSLLLFNKQLNTLSSFKTESLKISLKFDGIIRKRLYFQTCRSDKYNNLIYSNVKFQALFANLYINRETFRPKYLNYKIYEMIELNEEYSTFLDGLKCSSKYKKYSKNYPYYNHVLCHFECLQFIIEELLQCYFNLIPSNPTTSSKPFCALHHLVIIEEIIRNYSNLRNKFCKICLPECETNEYKISRLREEELLDRKIFIVDFYLPYKVIVRRHILFFTSSELLNFINGLWSLFLGISILSIWEIIEIGYVFTERYFLKFKSRKSLFANLNISETAIYKSLSLLFKDTNIHGLKHLFNDFTPDSAKIRWTIFILTISIGFVLTVKGTVNEYLEYKSDFKETIEPLIDNKLVLLNRKISVLFCTDLIKKNDSGVFDELDKLSSDLLKLNNMNLMNVVDAYKKAVLDLTFQYNISSAEILRDYENAFYSIQFKFSFGYDFKNRIKIGKFLFDKACSFYDTNVTAYDWRYGNKSIYFDSKEFRISASFVNNQNEKVQISLSNIMVFILDSQSLHAIQKSFFVPSNSMLSIRATVIYKELLKHPFKPSCNSHMGYKQRECFDDCFNNILQKNFGCKIRVLHLDLHENICKPYLLPLIINYRKLMHINECEQCVEPCEIYYYDLKVSSYDDGISTYFFISENINMIKQIPINTFENTLIILISYLSLFYGGTLLAIIHIFYNLASNMKFVKNHSIRNNNMVKKNSFLDVISNISSIHCINYLSSKKMETQISDYFG